jgi:ribose transport system substrate-binding protein
MRIYFARLFFMLGLGLSAQAALAQPDMPADGVSRGWEEIQQIVARAGESGGRWNGPTTGPKRYPGPVTGPAMLMGATVAIVCEDLRNGGILGVARGIGEAIKVIGWNAKIYDAGGTPEGRGKALAAALAARPDGVILVGSDAREIQAHLQPFAANGIPIVGWHIGPVAGTLADGPVAMNVSTNPLDVARVTAMAAVVESKGRAGVVIFTDSNFAIAKAKSDAMAAVIRACKGCTVLEIRDVAISKNAQLMPEVTRELLASYGKRWTHALAINDIYFDYAAPELTRAGQASNGISMLSAGDGSAAAFLRIQAGTFQTATVAEPLNLQGWQLVDELNRLLGHQPVSGYIAPVHLVTRKNIAFDGGPQMRFDPDNGYRDVYQRIWK